MRLLLDTHVIIWAWQEPARLSQLAHNMIADTANECIVSAACVWEIAIKQASGKLKLPGHAATWVPQAIARFRFGLLAMSGEHALAAGSLPRIHGDPFDRMLVAQAQIEGLELVTADPVFRQYSVPLHLI